MIMFHKYIHVPLDFTLFPPSLRDYCQQHGRRFTDFSCSSPLDPPQSLRRAFVS